MIEMNVYKRADAWFAAVFVDGAFDFCDELEATTSTEAIKEAENMVLSHDLPRTVKKI